MSQALTNVAVGPYIIRDLISAGGVAEVYRAQHQETHREYAAKIIRPERQAEKHHLKNFKEEFELLQQLDHPCIPKSRRFEDVKGRACMILDFVPGMPLHRVKEENKPFDAQSAFLGLVEIVAYLHEQGVVHNDLKLENVILRPDGKVALVDFGNARQQQKKGIFGRLFARKEPTFGTPTYLAPELICGEGDPSFRSDNYSLGVCCFVLLTGEPPFTYDRKSARLRAAVNQVAPSLASRRTGLAPSFVKLIDACLAKDPNLRPEDATRLHHACRIIKKASGAAGVGSIEV